MDTLGMLMFRHYNRPYIDIPSFFKFWNEETKTTTGATYMTTITTFLAATQVLYVKNHSNNEFKQNQYFPPIANATMNNTDHPLNVNLNGPIIIAKVLSPSPSIAFHSTFSRFKNSKKSKRNWHWRKTIVRNVRWRNPILGLIMIFACILTVLGNFLVVVAVCTKKYLRKSPTGYVIVSLAVADLIVGLIVMPLNSLYEMTMHTWLFGLVVCDIFHALDILASTCSIWNLCIISLVTRKATHDPIGYRDRLSKRRILIFIGLVWIISACISFPAIFWWRSTSPHLYKNPTICLFTDSKFYMIFSSLVSFYMPLILILFAYSHVFLIATRHSQSRIRGEKQIYSKDKSSSEDHNTRNKLLRILRITRTENNNQYDQILDLSEICDNVNENNSITAKRSLEETRSNSSAVDTLRIHGGGRKKRNVTSYNHNCSTPPQSSFMAPIHDRFENVLRKSRSNQNNNFYDLSEPMFHSFNPLSQNEEISPLLYKLANIDKMQSSTNSVNETNKTRQISSSHQAFLSPSQYIKEPETNNNNSIIFDEVVSNKCRLKVLDDFATQDDEVDRGRWHWQRRSISTSSLKPKRGEKNYHSSETLTQKFSTLSADPIRTCTMYNEERLINLWLPTTYLNDDLINENDVLSASASILPLNYDNTLLSTKLRRRSFAGGCLLQNRISLTMPLERSTVDNTQNPKQNSAPLRKSGFKRGVREKSQQMLCFLQEARAARTLGIVVGVFILCWAPFFIFAPVMVICKNCVVNAATVFSMVTWAGHLNSMMNPFIYSQFSREFRKATRYSTIPKF